MLIHRDRPCYFASARLKLLIDRTAVTVTQLTRCTSCVRWSYDSSHWRKTAFRLSMSPSSVSAFNFGNLKNNIAPQLTRLNIKWKWTYTTSLLRLFGVDMHINYRVNILPRSVQELTSEDTTSCLVLPRWSSKKRLLPVTYARLCAADIRKDIQYSCSQSSTI